MIKSPIKRNSFALRANDISQTGTSNLSTPFVRSNNVLFCLIRICIDCKFVELYGQHTSTVPPIPPLPGTDGHETLKGTMFLASSILRTYLTVIAVIVLAELRGERKFRHRRGPKSFSKWKEIIAYQWSVNAVVFLERVLLRFLLGHTSLTVPPTPARTPLTAKPTPCLKKRRGRIGAGMLTRNTRFTNAGLSSM